jgi:hypothetical protein
MSQSAPPRSGAVQAHGGELVTFANVVCGWQREVFCVAVRREFADAILRLVM